MLLLQLLISGVGKPDHDMGLGYPGGLITRRAVSAKPYWAAVSSNQPPATFIDLLFKMELQNLASPNQFLDNSRNNPKI